MKAEPGNPGLLFVLTILSREAEIAVLRDTSRTPAARRTHSSDRLTESEPLAREAMEFDRKKQPNDWRGFRAETLLSASLAGQKKYAEAEPLLLEGPLNIAGILRNSESRLEHQPARRHKPSLGYADVVEAEAHRKARRGFSLSSQFLRTGSRRYSIGRIFVQCLGASARCWVMAWQPRSHPSCWAFRTRLPSRPC